MSYMSYIQSKQYTYREIRNHYSDYICKCMNVQKKIEPEQEM